MQANKTNKTQKQMLARFLGATLLPILLLGITISYGILSLNEQHSFAQKEVKGTFGVHLLFKTMSDIQELRGISQILLWDNNSKMASHAAAIKKRLEIRLTSPKWKNLCKEFGIFQDVSKNYSELQNLYNSKEIKSSADITYTKFDRYTKLIEELRRTIHLVSDRSNLILDPELDTYYLMEIAVKQIPDISEAFAIIRGIGSGMIAHDSPGNKDRALCFEKLLLIKAQLKEFNHVVATISNEAPELQAEIKATRAKYSPPLESFIATCDSLGKGKEINMSAELFFQLGSQSVGIWCKIHETTILELRQRLETRLTSLRQKMIITILFAVITIGFVFYFSLSYFLKLQQSFCDLEKTSITDPLTGLNNRRYLDFIFENEIMRSQRDSKGVAFGLMDIDFFKPYNDTYGHQMGDIALQKVAHAFRMSLPRAGDFIFRYGGEEFCFLINSTSKEDVIRIGERIRADIEALGIEHRNSKVKPVITISIGIIFVEKVSGETLDTMIKQADDLLYLAKEQGRNRCIVSTIPPKTT